MSNKPAANSMETTASPTLSTVNHSPLNVLTRRLWFPDYGCSLDKVDDFRKRVCALLRAAGKDEPLFHNHGQDKEYNYDFPEIQYRSLAGIQGSPAGIWGFGQEAMRAMGVFEEALFMPGIARQTGLESCFNYSSTTQTTTVGLMAASQNYLVRDFPLNLRQAEQWQQNPSRRNQDEILRKDLVFRIFGFLNTLGYQVPDKLLRIDVLDIPKGAWLQNPPDFHGDKGKGRVLMMDVEFSANIDLPEFVGLGIHKAYGWGVLQRIP